MKNKIIILSTIISVFTNHICNGQQSIKYSLTENEDYHDEIKAVINGKEYILISL